MADDASEAHARQIQASRKTFDNDGVRNATSPSATFGYHHGPIKNRNHGWVPRHPGDDSTVPAGSVAENAASPVPGATMSSINSLVCDMVVDPDTGAMCGISFNSQRNSQPDLRRHIRARHPGALLNPSRLKQVRTNWSPGKMRSVAGCCIRVGAMPTTSTSQASAQPSPSSGSMQTNASGLRLRMRTLLPSLAVCSIAAPFGLTSKAQPLLPPLRHTLPPPSASVLMTTVLRRPNQGSGLLNKNAHVDTPAAGTRRSNRAGHG
jgi:hypothetical protein